MLVSQLFCVLVSVKRVPKAILRPRGKVQGSILSNGCTRASPASLVWRTGRGCIGAAPVQQEDRLQPLTLRSSLRSKKSGLGGKFPVGIRNLVMAALFLWMCCVRFEHMQSSIVLLEWEQARLPMVYASFHPSRP